MQKNTKSGIQCQAFDYYFDQETGSGCGMEVLSAPEWQAQGRLCNASKQQLTWPGCIQPSGRLVLIRDEKP